MGKRSAGDVNHDNSRVTEEPYDGKLSSTVLESSGGGDSFTDFNHLKKGSQYGRADRIFKAWGD